MHWSGGQGAPDQVTNPPRGQGRVSPGVPTAPGSVAGGIEIAVGFRNIGRAVVVFAAIAIDDTDTVRAALAGPGGEDRTVGILAEVDRVVAVGGGIGRAAVLGQRGFLAVDVDGTAVTGASGALLGR